MILAAFICLTPPAGSAWALTITDTQTFSVPVSLLGPQALFLSVGITISKFDPSLGQLTEVDLDLSAMATWDSFSIGDPASLDTGFAEAAYSRDLFYMVSGSLGVISSDVLLFSCSGGIFSGCVNSGAGPDLVHFGNLILDAADPEFSDFIGLGTVPVTGRFDSSLVFTGCASGSCSASTEATWSGEATITYTFVPEPTTTLLLACGLVGLGVRRRLH